MAQFDISAHISDGTKLEWLTLPDLGEHPLDVESQVRKAAMQMFGDAVYLKYWTHSVASNGYIVVQMHA